MDKKHFIFLLLAFISLNVLYSNPPFQIERLGTDYNGVIGANDRIIAYGNNGVLTYSDDFGDTWKQINLGEFNHILKIIKDEENILYALTPKSILFSKDGGNSWTQKSLRKDITLLDFALRNGMIYFITQNAVWAVDKELKSSPTKFLEFDDFVSFSKCEPLGKYLFVIEANYYIYRIDTETKQIDTIDVHTKVKMDSYYRDVANIKVNGSDLYVLVANGLSSQIESEYRNIRHLVIKSTDYGDNWKDVTWDIPVSKEFLVEKDGSVATLAPICFYFGERFPYFGVSFVRTKGKEFTEYIQKDSLGIWLPYYRGSKNLNKYRISQILRVKDNLIVAVGGNKTILISKDNGANWVMKSFFRPIFRMTFGSNAYNIQVLSKDTIVVPTNTIPFCFYSVDGGATFLPISRKQALFIKSNLSLQWVPLSFSSGPFGLIGYKATEQNSISGTLVGIYSSDLGKTFSTVEYPIGYVLNNDSMQSFFHHGFLLQETNEFLISFFRVRLYDKYSGPKYLLCRFDDKFRLVDTTLLYNFWSGIVPYPGGLIFSDGTDLYSSSDYGKTLVRLTKLPRSSYYIDKYDYISNIILGTVKNNLFLYESTPISGRLLKFDLTANSFDSLPLMKVVSINLFASNDTVFITTENGIYIFPDIQNDFTNFDLIPLEYIVTGKPSIKSSIPGIKPEVLTLELNDLAESFDFDTYIPLNLAKFRGESSYLRVEPEVDKDFVYLFAFPPYPNPAQNWVNVRVYWDSADPSKVVDVAFFDVFGRKFNLPMETSEESNSAMIRINTSTLGLGTYYLRVSYGYKTIVYPVLIVK